MTPIDVFISFMVSLAANGATALVQGARRREVDSVLADQEALQGAASKWRSLAEELSAACIRLAREKNRLGVPKHEAALWRLLADPLFQKDLQVWFVAGGISEGDAARGRLAEAMERALVEGGAPDDRSAFLRAGYFAALEKTFFSNSTLASWRFQASLGYLREQVIELRRLAEERAGIYAPEKAKEVMDRYCVLALKQWDIVDLTGLPQDDVDIATQALLLRQLYQPLRVTVEEKGRAAESLEWIEQRRAALRQWEAGRMDGAAATPDSGKRVPVGECLAASHRLVVLGDPGAGKTTLLRWMATAYLLRQRQEDDRRHLPDVETLPDTPWIPVLIRCRELGDADLSRCFSDFLGQHLKRSDLLPADAEVMCAVLLDRIARGEVLLLVDGLDEITDTRVRVLLCQELEQTAARYPAAPILVTSRVVGYRDMPHRLGRDFEHCLVAPLSPADKDEFAGRWVRATDRNLSEADQSTRIADLRVALHSSDRIERLASNPMMLTTLTLVKRKVGKLPSRRTKLYREAVGVLLNWNPGRYEVIEEEEALPQLEYVAYEMCRRGLQQLKEEEILNLIEQMRSEFRNLRATRRRAPEEFLALLEARSSLLIKAGGSWDKDLVRSWPVWEFRHLTFQEYLAAQALVNGWYPGREKGRMLATQVGGLAGQVQETVGPGEPENQVYESWRETLRLLVTDCPVDDVDDVLLAILRPREGEDPSRVARPRAIQAALCLADEPNVSEETVGDVLENLAIAVGNQDGRGLLLSPLDIAAREVAGSTWGMRLRERLIQEFMQRPPETCLRPGGLAAMLEISASSTRVEDLPALLASAEPEHRCASMLFCMEFAYVGLGQVPIGVVKLLLSALVRGGPETTAALWAMMWLSTPAGPGRIARPMWRPTDEEVSELIATYAGLHEEPSKRFCQSVLADARSPSAIEVQLDGAQSPNQKLRDVALRGLSGQCRPEAVDRLLPALDRADAGVAKVILRALGEIGDPRALDAIGLKLADPSDDVVGFAIRALGTLGHRGAIPWLIPLLEKPAVSLAAAMALYALGNRSGIPFLRATMESDKQETRTKAIEALAQGVDEIDRRLLSRDLDGLDPWSDPRSPITHIRVTKASKSLGLPESEIRSRFEAMADLCCLTLEWLPAPEQL